MSGVHQRERGRKRRTPRVCETSLGLGGDDAREGGGDSEDGKLHGRC